jgi:hypothetical protein
MYENSFYRVKKLPAGERFHRFTCYPLLPPYLEELACITSLLPVICSLKIDVRGRVNESYSDLKADIRKIIVEVSKVP